jgi:hypothetical protein
MNKKIKHIALLFALLNGVLCNVFTSAVVHDASKIGVEKRAVECESIKAWEEILNLKAHASLRTNTTFLDDFLGSSLGLRPEHTQQGPMIGKKIGHTFSKHGSHNTKQLLYQSVNGTVPNGQWLDDVAAEDFIARHLDQLGQGTRDIPLPASVRGIGRVFKNGDGQIIEATHIRLVPSGTGVDTAFSINETLVSLNPLGVYKP